LAQKLAQLAGKDGRLGHNIATLMNQAVNQMKNAAQSLKGGQPGQGFTQAREGGYGLNTVASKLEKLAGGELQHTDTAAEEYPREYESVIKEYLKRLSHQE
jgi:hypothetical protein